RDARRAAYARRREVPPARPGGQRECPSPPERRETRRGSRGCSRRGSRLLELTPAQVGLAGELGAPPGAVRLLAVLQGPPLLDPDEDEVEDAEQGDRGEHPDEERPEEDREHQADQEREGQQPVRPDRGHWLSRPRRRSARSGRRPSGRP